MSRLTQSISKKRLRLILGAFTLALSAPGAILMFQALSQMKWESYRQHQILAEELVTHINTDLTKLIEKEEARPFSDYSFLTATGDLRNNFLQRSPLAALPSESDIPGLIGYFQIDTQGHFSSPLLPTTQNAALGLTHQEQQERETIHNSIINILSSNQLVKNDRAKKLDTIASKDKAKNEAFAKESIALLDSIATSERSRAAPATQRDFDDLLEADDEVFATKPSLEKSKQNFQSLGSVADLNLKQQFKTEELEEAPLALEERKAVTTKLKKQSRKEQVILPEAITTSPSPTQETSYKVTTFESEIDPFNFSQLDSGHFVLFRKVWRDDQRYIQGLLIDQEQFTQAIINTSFVRSALASMSSVVVAFQHEVLSVFSGANTRSFYSSASDFSGDLLHRSRLLSPFADMELIFSINELPPSAGANIVIWTTLTFALILLGGITLIYRLAYKQLMLAQQQQDFISAVSHELKTPLTSIRMYAEMLTEGWSSEEKKKGYYHYIFDESERLSRLINNVLQLARMTRNETQLNLKPTKLTTLHGIIASKIATQIEQQQFTLNLDLTSHEATLDVDEDAITQIFINLVDNALKFSAKAEAQRIDIHSQILNNQQVMISIRDYGPGIDKKQMKKIFQLFYRSENELTRETVGTGIGLALVSQLTSQMHGKIDVVNKTPGAEFRLILPLT